ncbi:DUF6278 family protein [Specibacter cremeus]|uniref:DUF6278 family protein n=1 Tax=Specibacter cremeus TaxID=1629051 RepID=UPI000F78DA99|nr:DUF6278 family protein [Specibacter cremeus]
MSRWYAEYKSADLVSAPPPTNVGGYGELLNHFHARGHLLPQTEEGLAAIDDLINSAVDIDLLAELARPIGMFYGDVLTHTIPGAYWEVIKDGYPRVRVTRTFAVDVVRVANRRLAIADPTLVQNYAYVLGIVRHDA